MEYKVGDKFKGTAEIIERHIGIDKDSILTISKIENDLIYLNCENYNYVWCIKDDFNKYFIPFKDDNIIEYQGKKYDVALSVENDDCSLLMIKEHKEEILDETEKEYLGNVIRPFRNKVLHITKKKFLYSGYGIRIQLNNDFTTLPCFTDKRMYKGMVDNQPYTLEELGL